MAEVQASNADVRAFTIDEFAKRWAISKGFVYKLARRGDLRLTKILSRTVITIEEERRFAAKMSGSSAGSAA